MAPYLSLVFATADNTKPSTTTTPGFLTRDPIGFADGYNLTALYFILDGMDPEGLNSLVIGGTAGTIAGLLQQIAAGGPGLTAALAALRAALAVISGAGWIAAGLITLGTACLISGARRARRARRAMSECGSGYADCAARAAMNSRSCANRDCPNGFQSFSSETICLIKYGGPFLGGCSEAWLWCVGKRLLSCGWAGRFPIVKMPCTNKCWYLCKCNPDKDEDGPDDIGNPPVSPINPNPVIEIPGFNPVIAA